MQTEVIKIDRENMDLDAERGGVRSEKRRACGISDRRPSTVLVGVFMKSSERFMRQRDGLRIIL